MLTYGGQQFFSFLSRLRDRISYRRRFILGNVRWPQIATTHFSYSLLVFFKIGSDCNPKFSFWNPSSVFPVRNCYMWKDAKR